MLCLKCGRAIPEDRFFCAACQKEEDEVVHQEGQEGQEEPPLLDPKAWEYINTPVQYLGWLCPRCGRILSPYVHECFCTPPTVTVTSASSGL